jgi:Peptidase MA superfamily
MGRLTALAAVALLALGLGPLAGGVRAADPVQFGNPTASGSFGEDIVFTQPVTVSRALARVELLLTVDGAIGPEVIEVDPPSGTGSQTLSYHVATGEDHLLPNTPVRGAWRVTAADGSAPATGPQASLVYADERFTWRSTSGPVVHVHWYEGSDAFGARALQIAEDGIDKAASLLGVTEEEPVDFFIYADEGSFRDALGPSTRENVGGQADPEIRTLFALIPPSQIDDAWVETVIPHELTHLVLDTAVHNPYHFPPRWLNEGLAVYESEGYPPDYRSAVDDAARRATLIPLSGLVGQFPTSGDRFRLAYGESVSAVDFFVRTYGQDALVTLISSYADGVTDDEAFKEAVSVDVDGFEAAWLADLHADTPVRQGPRPAPAGPLPAGWASAPSPDPNASAFPVASQAPTASPTDQGSDTPIGLLLAVVIALVAVVGGLVLVARRRAARTPG